MVREIKRKNQPIRREAKQPISIQRPELKNLSLPHGKRVMFGRNMWLRPFDEAIDLTRKVRRILSRYGTTEAP
jgi:hypothetical protein